MLLFDIYISPTDLFLHLCSTCFFVFVFLNGWFVLLQLHLWTSIVIWYSLRQIIYDLKSDVYQFAPVRTSKPKHLAYHMSSFLTEKFAELKWQLPGHLSNWTPSSPVWELRVPGATFRPHTKGTPQSAANGLSPLPWHLRSERATRKEETTMSLTELTSCVKVVVAILHTCKVKHTCAVSQVRWRPSLQWTHKLRASRSILCPFAVALVRWRCLLRQTQTRCTPQCIILFTCTVPQVRWGHSQQRTLNLHTQTTWTSCVQPAVDCISRSGPRSV